MNPGGRGQNVGLGMRSLAKTVVKVDAFREDPSLQGVADSMGRRLTLVPSIAFLLLLMPFFAVHCNGSKVGVCYGRNADDLPTPDKVAQLIQLHSIKYVRIYDSNIQVIKAFANTGVELMVGVPNSDLLPFSQYQSNVDTWLKNSILPYYPATMITYITVGAEVTEIKDNVSALVVPAMVNVLTALKKVGLHKRIKVSSTHSLGILSRSFPPSAGALDSKYAFFLKPMLEFLVENNSPFMVDLYPYYAYRESPSNVSLDYALFSSSAVDVIDPNTGLVYTNMFDAQLDSIFFALMALNFRTLKIMVTESGWPNKGAAKETAATPDNAQTYNTNLIRHVVNDAGTPTKPGEQIDIYVFSLFNENRKPGLESERNWGLFYPDQTSVYSLDWTGMGNVDIVTGANITSSNGTWCVASSNASDADLQNALNWACGSGNVDCSAIQPSQPCYQPDTLASHASYAFNSFYQLNGATDVACNFGGTGVKTIKDPSYDACVYSTSSKMGTGNSTTSAALTSSSEGSNPSWLKESLPYMFTLLFVYIAGIASH
ncbi:glucan endo-1,3-beta-glucosidase 13-like [Zingiber officinale]|uniref:glucan endo-1,3-beta-glucosidase 13-like n=1 Tax=Zingiber officinale TaxID=94328 RepID=UPI001C4AE053|nr:glucan endo-1,3-beta-glucosidase 13-like [Zingiber officinale]